MVVSTIFKKAQNEKEYCNFYGDLCQRIIELELALRGKKKTVGNMKYSEFRKALLNFCKGSFDQFFGQAEMVKQMEEEEQYKHKDRLMGNVKFLGELNRRN